MSKSEKPIQYGLGGDFGGPQPEKETVMDDAEQVMSTEDKERLERRRVVPVGTIVYKANQPDKPFTVPKGEAFYVLLPKKKSRAAVKTVRIDSPRVTLYRDGEYFTWVNDPSLLDDNSDDEYVLAIEVHSSRLPKPKKKK
jgi:hypothetical protein